MQYGGECNAYMEKIMWHDDIASKCHMGCMGA